MRSRRSVLQGMAMTAAAGAMRGLAGAQLRAPIATGKFQPTWESLRQWRMPEWFRDAKFGIWAHWTAQCVPEQGDWYARRMYEQGSAQYEFHCKTYGHPTEFGFMQIDHLWKAERWEPERLMDLYVKAGAKYFYALAAHHDNFDCFASSHHGWNSTKVGPGRDIVGTWEKLARSRGVRFGVSNHASHAWHWLQTAYGYDAEGPKAGQRYDAYTLSRAQGKGTWWEGLDPRDLYTGRNLVIPDGITTIAAANAWHEKNDRVWNEEAPAVNPEFTRKWFLRCKELIDRYKPDMVYFDDAEIPLGQAGLDIVAHYYNRNMEWNGGREEAVVAVKTANPAHLGATMLDIERGRAQGILEQPWQTDTCIGDWHYKRSLYTEHKYKTPTWVVRSLVDIVSKNGNLMLNIPLRGDGSIDEDEHAFLEELARWMAVHGEGIYGTRPFTVFGEGPVDVGDSHNFNETKGRQLGAEDIRFTFKGEQLYAWVLGWPESGKVVIRALGKESAHSARPVRAVEMMGSKGALRFTQAAEALTIQMPEKPQERLEVYGFRILR